MQGSPTHIPETNQVPRGYIVAAIRSLLFMVPLCLVPALVLLFFYVSTFKIIIIIIDMNVSCHRYFFPGTALEPAVIPTAQASSFTLQYFPYYV